MNTRTTFVAVGLLVIIFAFLLVNQTTSVEALLGDLDYSGLVDANDLEIIDAAYGANGNTNPLPPNWDARADLNLDGYINLKDLALAGRSFGDSFNFYSHRRVSNGYDANPALTNPYWCDAAADAFGRVHVIWEEDRTSNDYLYYTQLDASGNALIEDLLISNDSLYARIAVGPDGSAHIVYQRHYSNSGIYYVRLNPDGSFFNGGGTVYDGTDADYPAIVVDEYNNGHLVYSESGDKVMYAIIGDNGKLLPATQLNPGSTTTASSPTITISPDGARHVLWRQATGVGGGELRYTRITKHGVLTANNQTVATLLGTYNLRHYYLAADSQSAIHLVYYDFREGLPGIYWRRVNSDGSLSTENLVSNSVINSAASSIAYVIDSADNLHLAASWKNGNGHVGYASLNRDGQVMKAFQRVVFEAETNKVAIPINSIGQAMILTPAYAGAPKPLLIFSTVTDQAAYDPNRADLVLDKAHLVIAKYLLKINEQADITVTITNGGAAPANGVTLTFSYPDLGGTISQINVFVGDVPAFSSIPVRQLIDVPEFEEVDAWEVAITAQTTTAETTSTNNDVVTPFGVVPPPRMFNLEVLPFDETFSPTDQSLAEPLSGANLILNCPTTGHQQTIASGDLFNVFWDIPLDTLPANQPLYPTTCQVTLTKAGFSSSSLDVTAQRFSVENPYAIKLSATRPVKLYINTWGNLVGTLKDKDSNPISGGILKLDSGQQTTSDGDGNFSFIKTPAGLHTLRVWAAGFTPIPNAEAIVTQGNTTTLPLTMQETKRAEVFGIVQNALTLPLAGAQVKFLKNSTQIGSLITGNDGSFSFFTEPYDKEATYQLEVSLSHYVTSTIPVSLTPGIPLEENIVLDYADDGGDLSTSGEIKSWVQDERWCKAYGEDEDLPLRVRILQAIGSKWCPSYQTVVNWGAFDYELGLNYTEEVDGNLVTELLINFTNQEFISYNVSSGRWHSGGETLAVTAQRIDWVELIAMDSSGNPVGTYVWHDENVRYSSTHADPVNPTWRIPINTLSPKWTQAAIRVFYTVGQYDESEEQNFRNWNPPADLGLAGSGSPSGADRQVITWMLISNNSSMRYSLADYRSAAGYLSLPGLPFVVTDQSEELVLEATSVINSLGNVAVTAVTSEPARVGTPYEVALSISGYEDQPVYAMEFDLAFNPAYLRLIDVTEAADFAGLNGSWHRDMNLDALNSAGKITASAVVRLAASSGLANGDVIRLMFLPIQVTPTTTKLDLSNIEFADLDSDKLVPESVTDLIVKVDKAQVFLPLLVK